MKGSEENISPVHAISLTSQFLNMYNTKTLTDVTVHCGKETFELHSPILSYGSGYFHEVLSDKVSSISLDFNPEIEPETFEVVAESFYTGTVKGINESNAEKILHAGFHLQASNIIKAGEAYLLSSLTVENALSYWLSSRFCGSTKVQKASISLMGKHLDQISNLQVYLDLHLDTIVDLLSDEDLKVASEQHVYEAAIAWIKYDEEKRAKDLNTVLDTVRLSALPVGFLVSVVGEEDLIENNSVAMSKYSRILKFKLDNKSFRRSTRSLPVDEKKRHDALTGVIRNVELQWASFVRMLQNTDWEGEFNKLTKSCKEKMPKKPEEEGSSSHDLSSIPEETEPTTEAKPNVMKKVEVQAVAFVKMLQGVDWKGEFEKLAQSCKEKMPKKNEKTSDKDLLEVTDSGLSEAPEDTESLISYTEPEAEIESESVAVSDDKPDDMEADAVPVPDVDSMAHSDIEIQEKNTGESTNEPTVSDDEGISLDSDTPTDDAVVTTTPIATDAPIVIDTPIVASA